jgi:hypothetical protein
MNTISVYWCVQVTGIEKFTVASSHILTYDIYEKKKLRTSVDCIDIRFRGFRLTQLYFSSCLLFDSNYPLNVSVVRPSSDGTIYIVFYILLHSFITEYLLFCPSM